MNNLLSELETEMKGKDAEKIRTKMQEIEGALNGIVRQHQQTSSSESGSGSDDAHDSSTPKDDDVVDADYEES